MRFLEMGNAMIVGGLLQKIMVPSLSRRRKMKTTTCITVDVECMIQVKERNINLSRFVDEALRKHLGM